MQPNLFCADLASIGNATDDRMPPLQDDAGGKCEPAPCRRRIFTIPISAMARSRHGLACMASARTTAHRAQMALTIKSNQYCAAALMGTGRPIHGRLIAL